MKVKRFSKKDNAVSPVVGVMLMLVATIVIAAVVQSYAGGIATSTPKAPQASFDVKIKNTGYWRDSGIFIKCLSTDEPIPSKDVKIVMVHEGNLTEVIPQTKNVNYTYIERGKSSVPANFKNVSYSGPVGYVNDSWSGAGDPPADVQFGNYTIESGVMIKASPMSAYGAKNQTHGALYKYFIVNQGETCPSNLGSMENCLLNGSIADPVQALLKDWEYVMPGDKVMVQIIHLPSGKTIFSKEVTVEG